VVRFRPDGGSAVSVSEDGTAIVWDASPRPPVLEPRELRRFQVKTGGSDWVVDGGGSRLFRVRRKPAAGFTAEVAELESGRALVEWEEPAEPTAACFSPDGAWVATVTSRAVTIRELADTTADVVHVVELPQAMREIPYVALSPDRGWLACIDKCPREDREIDPNARLMVRDLRTGATFVREKAHDERIFAVAFSPDSSALATAGEDRMVRVWSLVGGVGDTLACREFRGHGKTVASLVFSPDGRILASGSDASTVKLWDLATGTERATLTGFRGSVDGLAFSTDGLKLVTCGGHASSSIDEGQVRVYTATRPEE